MPTVVTAEDLMLTSLEKLEVFTLGAQDFMFMLEDLQNFDINHEMTINPITGARGVRLGSIKSGKGVSGTATNGILSLGALAAGVGGEVSRNQTATIRWRDTITAVAANTITLNYTPAGSPANIYGVYKQNSDGTLGTKFALTAETTPGAGEYKIAAKVITFGTDGIAIGDKVTVYYDRTITGATVISNPGDKFAKDVYMVATFLGEDKNCVQYLVQCTLPKVSLKGDSTLGAGDDAKTYDVNFEAYASKCSGDSNSYWTYTIVTDDVISAAEA